MSEQAASDVVDQFLKALAGGPAPTTTGGDAISQELARPSRVTSVVDLRDSETAERFRTAMTDALIENDAVRQALILVNTVLTKAFAII